MKLGGIHRQIDKEWRESGRKNRGVYHIRFVERWVMENLGAYYYRDGIEPTPVKKR